MTHVVLKSKDPYTELEFVVLPYLKVAADLIHGGKEAVKKVSKISLSDTTVSCRSQIIATDLEDQMIQKLKKAPLFAIQLDETTDIASQAQLIVFCRFTVTACEKITKHYLFCKPLVMETTANAILGTLDEYIKEKVLSWEKCKSATTDGAAAMTGSIHGVVKKIEEVSPECVSIHCILRREALVTKKLKKVAVKKMIWHSYSGKLLVLSTTFEATQKGAEYSQSCVKRWMRHSLNCCYIQK